MKLASKAHWILTLKTTKILKYEINMKNPFIDISGRRVGLDYEPLVIAEIGINHEGSLKVAKEMVDAAIKNGAEIIKHQTHIIEDEMSDDAKKLYQEMLMFLFIKSWRDVL